MKMVEELQLVTESRWVSLSFFKLAYHRKNERLQETGKIAPLVSYNFLADPKAIEILKCTSVEDSKWAYERMYDEKEQVLVC
jgi:hypothetical protein